MLLYRYKSLEHLEHVADILINQRLYCSPYYALNDPMEGLLVHSRMIPPCALWPKGIMCHTQKCVDDIVGGEDYVEFRVCSLSSDLGDVRLWSHYGGSHTGIAIEIDVSGCHDKFRKVNYGNALFRFCDPKYADPSPIEVLSYKTWHWEHEREYRIIGTHNYYPINGMIRRVIMGVNCKRTSRDVLKRLLPDSASLVRAKLDTDKLRIVVQEDIAGHYE